MGYIDSSDNRWSANAAIADLAGGATLADTIAKVNAILAALRESGTIAES